MGYDDDFDEPPGVGSLETRTRNLEKRIEKLERELNTKVDSESISWMRNSIFKLTDEWILFRLIKEIICIALFIGLIALVVSAFS